MRPSFSWATPWLISSSGALIALTHAQGEEGGDAEAGGDQQEAGEQAAISAQQGPVVRQFQFDPAEYALVVRLGGAGQAVVAAKNR